MGAFGSPAAEQGRQAFSSGAGRSAHAVGYPDRHRSHRQSPRRDIVLIPIAAVAIDRGADPGMDTACMLPIRTAES
jgi:hypothetical protein